MPHWSTLLLLVVLFFTGACGQQLADYPWRQPPEGFLSNPVNQSAGARLFAEKCASCHGTPGEGRSPRADFFQPPAPGFTEEKYRSIDPAYLFWRISKGKTIEPFLSRGSVMPAWGPHFSEKQIWQLVAYLRARGGPNI